MYFILNSFCWVIGEGVVFCMNRFMHNNPTLRYKDGWVNRVLFQVFFYSCRKVIFRWFAVSDIPDTCIVDGHKRSVICLRISSVFIFKCKLLREKGYFLPDQLTELGKNVCYFMLRNSSLGLWLTRTLNVKTVHFFFVCIAWFTKRYHVSNPSALGHGGYHIFILFLVFCFLACLYTVICLRGNLFSLVTHLLSSLQFSSAYIQVLL